MVVRNVMRAPLTWPEDMNRSATAVDEERKKEGGGGGRRKKKNEMMI